MTRRQIAAVVGLAVVVVAAVVFRSPVEPVQAPGVVPAVVTAVGGAVGGLARDITLVPDSTLVRGLIPQQATLDKLLRGHGVADDAAVAVVAAADRVFDLRRLRSLRPFSLERTVEGALRLFEYEIDADSSLVVRPMAPGATAWRAEIVPIPKTLEYAATAGRIDRSAPSLFQAMDAAGEGDELAMGLAAIFAGEVDFNSELQPGDRFALAFERYTREDGPTSYGAIRAAEFRNDGRVLRAIRFTPPGGKPSYYDELGHSLQRFFLRSPLRFEPRITSRFSASRKHPILHTSRAHKGVDYAAPTGAPVVAAAGGVVASVTTDRANGRMVRLRHPSGYESYYLHLSGFAAGLKAGTRVEQGDTIGFVGSSGLSTGPHLHYGLTKNGTFVNPLVEQRNLPPPAPLDPEVMAAFEEARDAALAQLARATAPDAAHRAGTGAAP
jgi:murein DD-endopeptidase MepM/ murein hydrolase activator NlpD